MKSKVKRGIYERFVKRVFDVFFSCIFLFLLSPVFLMVAIWVRVKFGAPVIFKQKRGGLGGQVFEILKFRTMTNNRDMQGNLLPDNERITGFGRFLRRTSLDELPQLVNILRGEMSFVGPRPQLAEFLPYYTEEENLRHSVRPGLTGLAQVKGRNALPWKERFAFDTEYVRKLTLWLDIKIIVLTVFSVFAKGKDVDIESFYERK